MVRRMKDRRMVHGYDLKDERWKDSYGMSMVRRMKDERMVMI